MIYYYPVEVNGIMKKYNPLKGIDTQEDYEIANVGFEIEELARKLAKMPEHNFLITTGLSKKYRQEI